MDVIRRDENEKPLRDHLSGVECRIVEPITGPLPEFAGGSEVERLRQQLAGAVETISTLRRALAACALRLEEAGYAEYAEDARLVITLTGGQ